MEYVLKSCYANKKEKLDKYLEMNIKFSKFPAFEIILGIPHEQISRQICNLHYLISSA